MALFRKDNNLTTSAIGNEVRQGDDVYYDRQYSRKRSNRWAENKFFAKAPIIIATIGSVVFTLAISLLMGALLMMFNGMGGMVSGHNSLFINLGVQFYVNPFMSAVVYSLTRWWVWMLGIVLGIVGAVVTAKYQDRIRVFNSDEDINDYEGDATILTVPEMVAKYKSVPDQGAHFKDVDVTGIVSHIALSNDGLKKRRLPVLESTDGLSKGDAKKLRVKRVIGFKASVPKEVVLKPGDVIKAKMDNLQSKKKEATTSYTVGEKASKKPFAIMRVKPKARVIAGRMYEGRRVTLQFPDGQQVVVIPDENILDKPVRAKQNLIDEEDAIRQFDNVGMRDKKLQKLHSPKKLYVNERNKQTLAEYIDENWYVPDYETQTPSGAYLVDDSPINVMIVAMTRGNKGQCMINPTLDLWSRQDKKVNIFVNDPKGELYTGFYATLKLRGFEVVVFNLLDSNFTDQFNPLAEAITYARKGYKDEPQKVLTNLAQNFFPMPEGQEPIWTLGERMLFRMLCLILMDVYYEEEQEYLNKYSGVYDEAQIQRDLDDMWGNVTLPNAYRMVSVLSTRKYQKKQFDGSPIIDPDTGLEIPPDEENMLEKLFELTNELPRSNIRELFADPYSNLMSMADSEKMRSSIYGMALTEMSFFVEAPVVALTSASPSQSFDLISMSFPRRFSFKFNEKLARDKGWIMMMVKFELYRDPYFKDKYEGDEYEHITRIDRMGWTEMRFEAVLDQPMTYVKMSIYSRGEQKTMSYGTYYAQFTKGYQTSTDGRTLVKDPITGEYQIKDGVLRMGVMKDITPEQVQDKYIDLEKFDRNEIKKVFDYGQPKASLNSGEHVNVIVLSEVAYQEKPLAVFSVTPPSALVYVKIILMIIHSMFNTTVENSYMTKDDGKPLLKTKYMLDEAGNLSYEGSGIDSLSTKLSIGLAQGQEYTLVFQTLQQITDIYGETADRIISSNTGLSAFLLSNDLDMLETMSQQAGTRHVGRRNSKNVTKNVGTMTDHIENAVSYTTSIEEEPLFSVNRLLRMTNGESLMLSTTKRNNNDGSNARQQPVFNTQDTSLPMAWSLHKYGYGQRSYSMLTVPTLNSTVNMEEKYPPFESIIYKRAAQAAIAPNVIDGYKAEHGLTDIEYDMLDPNEIGPEIMRRINRMLELLNTMSEDEREELRQEVEEEEAQKELELNGLDPTMTRDDLDRKIHEGTGMRVSHSEDGKVTLNDLTTDVEVVEEKEAQDAEQQALQQKTLGNGRFSREEMATGQMKSAITRALEVLRRDYLTAYPDWELDNASSPVTLRFKGRMMAKKMNVQQYQEHENADTGESMSTVEQGAGWITEPDLFDVLGSTPDWTSLLGTPFVDKVEQYFTQDDSGVSGMRTM